MPVCCVMLTITLKPIARRGSRRFAPFPFLPRCKTTQARCMAEQDSEKNVVAEDDQDVIRRVNALELLLRYAITQRLRRSLPIVAQGRRDLVAGFLAGQSFN